MENEGKLANKPVREMMQSDAIPELDEKIRGLKTELNDSPKKREKIGLSELMSKLEVALSEKGENALSEDAEWKTELELAICKKVLSEVTEVNHSLEAMNSKLEKALIEIDEDNQRLQAKILKLEKSLIEKGNEISNLKKQAATHLEEKLHVLGTQKKAADATIAKLTDQLTRAGSQKVALGKKNEENQVELNKKHKDLESLKDKMEVLQKMIAERDEQMKELETKISDKESLISTLSEALRSVITTATAKMSMP